MNSSNAPIKRNFKHFVVNAAALTVEKTFTPSQNMPTVTFEISSSVKNADAANSFDHANKWVLQLNPSIELPEMLAVLLTYKKKCTFSYHSATKNHSLSAEWIPAEESLKFNFLFAGSNRFIVMPRPKVFELAMFCADALIQSLYLNQTVSKRQQLTFSDIDTFISRAYRPFKDRN